VLHAIAVMIGWSRVRCRAHHRSDVVAGALLGYGVAWQVERLGSKVRAIGSRPQVVEAPPAVAPKRPVAAPTPPAPMSLRDRDAGSAREMPLAEAA
jgi:hypothetical protein